MPEFEATRDKQAPAAGGGAKPPEAEPPESPETGELRDTEAETEELEEQKRRFADEGGTLA